MVDRLLQVKLELVPRVEAVESDAQESGAHGCVCMCAYICIYNIHMYS